MGLAGALGAMLLSGSNYGYRLAATLEAELGPVWTARPSQLYLTLGRMQRDGWLVVERVSQVRRPDRRLLSLTRAGRRHAQAWIDAVGDEDLVVRLAVARIAVPGALPGLVRRAIADRAVRLRNLRAIRDAEEGGFRREAVESEIGRAQAELKWLETIEARAEELAAAPPVERARRRVMRVVG
jgi:DNA-binding PadR family transcriptional regulator